MRHVYTCGCVSESIEDPNGSLPTLLFTACKETCHLVQFVLQEADEQGKEAYVVEI